jgi:LPXTG-motif cell wall-anchored protein
MAALAVAAPLATALPAPPAGAHSGGRAQLYVDSIHLEPLADGWLTTLSVRDADSGRLEAGYGVQVAGSGPGGQAVGPVSLTDPDADGRYQATVPMTVGGWSLTVKADEIAGGPRAVPFRRTWPVTLEPGRPVDVAGPSPSAPPAGPGAADRTIPLLLGLVAAATLSGLVLRRRKKSEPPASRRARATPVAGSSANVEPS